MLEVLCMYVISLVIHSWLIFIYKQRESNRLIDLLRKVIDVVFLLTKK